MMKIAIASGKGGTGKTFVATNIFYSLCKNNRSAMLVDCDAEAPNAIAFFDVNLVNSDDVSQRVPVISSNACTYCGKCHDWCNYNAIFILPPVKVIQVIEDLCHGCGACVVACQYDAITEKLVSLGKVNSYLLNGVVSLIEARMNIGVMSPVSVIKAALKKADTMADFIILDSPPGTSCPFIQTALAADFVILVTEPTPFSFSDLKQSVETLKKINKPFGVIVNKAGLGNADIYFYLEKEKIQLLHEILFDIEIAELYSTGKIVAETKQYLEIEFYNMIKKIMRQYGNSDNQR
ncbi:MAG: ATP-binding protein [Bacteroidetes bacterium]|nr:ATP-binding protein [Bacteroidota bacterium]